MGILFIADSGLRRAEVIALNWEDVDIMSRLVRIKRGKGRIARSEIIGANTRRALLAYRRTLANPTDETPVFVSRTGDRFTGIGVLLIFRRLTKKTGIHITPHALRRTFVILSLRAGMDVLHGSPFDSYVIPGLALGLIVGGSALFAAVLLIRKSRFALLASVAAGLIIMFFEFVEVLVIGSPAGPAFGLQVFYFGLGMVIVVVSLGQWFFELLTGSITSS